MVDPGHGEKLRGEVRRMRPKRRASERAHSSVRKREARALGPQMACMDVQDPSGSGFTI